MGKQGLLVAGLGVRRQQTGETAVGAIASSMKSAFPGWQVEQAYLEPVVRRSGGRQGQELVSPAQVIGRMADRGVTRLVIQPACLLCGWEYHRLQQEAAEQAVRLQKVSWGAPLLSGPEDHRQVAQALVRAFPVVPEEALVLVGHGTDHPIQAAYLSLAQMFRALGHSHVFVGTLKGWPRFPDVWEQLRQAGYRRALLAPLMLSAGKHAQKDLAEGPDSWKYRLEQEALKVRCVLQGLGQLEQVRQVYVEHARQAMSRLDRSESGDGGEQR